MGKGARRRAPRTAGAHHNEECMSKDASEFTLCIIKPDAVSKKYQAQILQRIIDEGFEIVALRQDTLSRAEAEGFYAVHRERPFFGELVGYMTTGPVVLAALRRRNAPDVDRLRRLGCRRRRRGAARTSAAALS